MNKILNDKIESLLLENEIEYEYDKNLPDNELLEIYNKISLFPTKTKVAFYKIGLANVMVEFINYKANTNNKEDTTQLFSSIYATYCTKIEESNYDYDKVDEELDQVLNSLLEDLKPTSFQVFIGSINSMLMPMAVNLIVLLIIWVLLFR